MHDGDLSAGQAKILAIQSLRGVAAIAVALFHLSLAQEQFFPKREPFMAAFYGLWGVDLFFVISGFIMVYITTYNDQKQKISVLSFWRDRAIRIVPAYWLFTLAAYILSLLLHEHIKKIKPHSIENLLSSLLFIKVDAFPVLPVGWTLNYEMFFYLCFGLSMAISYRHRAIIASIFFVGLVLVGLTIKFEQPYAKFICNPIILEFVMGMLVAGIYLERKPLSHKSSCLISSIAAVLLIIGISIPEEQSRLDNRVLYMGLPTALLLCGALNLRYINSKGVLSSLGDMSYSIYLAHLPIYAVVIFVLKIYPFAANPNAALVIMAPILLILISHLSYRYIERGCSNALKGM